MKKLIVIADWAQDLFACQLFRSTVEGFLENPQNPNISFINSSSSLEASFKIQQILLTEKQYGRPLDTVIYQISPRDSETEIELDAQGNDSIESSDVFTIARTASGMHICGTPNGYAYSLIKDDIEALFTYENIDESKRTQSEAVYARLAAHLMDSLEQELDLNEISKDTLEEPDLHDTFYLMHIDSSENMIISLTESRVKEVLRYNETLKITINSHTNQVTFEKKEHTADFNVLSIAASEFGEIGNHYMKIFIKPDLSDNNNQKFITALRAFHSPHTGTRIKIDLD